jgi:hypothetical protein
VLRTKIAGDLEKTFLRLLRGVRSIVQEDLKNVIPANFGVIFDGKVLH